MDNQGEQFDYIHPFNADPRFTALLARLCGTDNQVLGFCLRNQVIVVFNGFDLYNKENARESRQVECNPCLKL